MKRKINGKRISIILMILGATFILLFLYFNNKKEEVITYNNINYNDGTISFEISNKKDAISCAVISSKENIKNKKITWNKIKNGKCTYQIKSNNNYYIYIKHEGKIIKLDQTNQILEISLSKDQYYLSKKAKEQIKYEITSIGDNNRVEITSKNTNIALVAEQTLIGNKVGNTTVTIKSKQIKKDIKVTVTNLISKMPKNYDYSKSYIPCHKYSEKQAQLLDNILKDRVASAGYKTRAGVVAAGRFLTLEFKYKIKYFSENGRLNNYDGGATVDGEGRYLHRGLYLTDNKFSELTAIDKGPNPWGCMIYSRPSKGQRANGLDCSGFTTWVVYNGGFDIEDVSAHGNSDVFDINEYGEEESLTKELALKNKIKAGDLLGEYKESGGHSAIILGVSKSYYYVAESLWIYPYGVNLNKYKKEDLPKYFDTVNLMDSYYKEEGNYTPMWY